MRILRDVAVGLGASVGDRRDIRQTDRHAMAHADDDTLDLVERFRPAATLDAPGAISRDHVAADRAHVAVGERPLHGKCVDAAYCQRRWIEFNGDLSPPAADDVDRRYVGYFFEHFLQLSTHG